MKIKLNEPLSDEELSAKIEELGLDKTVIFYMPDPLNTEIDIEFFEDYDPAVHGAYYKYFREVTRLVKKHFKNCTVLQNAP
jgi:hypothetical protein